MVSLLSDRVLRDSHVASLLGMTRQGGTAVHQCPPAVECSPYRALTERRYRRNRFVRFYQCPCTNCKCLPEIAAACTFAITTPETFRFPPRPIAAFPAPVKPQFCRSGKLLKLMSRQETPKPASSPLISNFLPENPRCEVDIRPVLSRPSGCAGCECRQSIHAIMHRSSGVFHMGLCRESC